MLKVNNSMKFCVVSATHTNACLVFYFLPDGIFVFPVETDHCPLYLDLYVLGDDASIS